jgi:drug/metabolite transporter (DMT)-like permease
MDRERNESGRLTRSVVAAFVALAVLVAIVPVWTKGALDFLLPFQELAGSALCFSVAGIVLMLLGAAVKQRMLDARQWLAILALLMPQWLTHALDVSYVGDVRWLHSPPSGYGFLLSIAAPLWLALLSAMQRVQEEVPRAVAGAAIAGIGAVCLVHSTHDYSVEPKQIPVALVQLLLSIATVYAWAYAKPRLALAGTLMAAGSFLLLSALGEGGFWLLSERRSWQPVEWGEVVAPLLLQAGVVAASWWLWFWLLERMTLAAFGMRAVAVWAAVLIFALANSDLLDWRLDWRMYVALAISVGAIVVALRARVSEEQPVALGLNAS